MAVGHGILEWSVQPMGNVMAVPGSEVLLKAAAQLTVLRPAEGVLCTLPHSD